MATEEHEIDRMNAGMSHSSQKPGYRKKLTGEEHVALPK
jgi:hypothetical protein